MGYPNVSGAGVPVHGEFSSANASGLSEPSSRFALYGPGQTAALAVGAVNQVSVTDLVVTVGSTALTVQVYDGPNNAVDPGELIAKVAVPANTTVVIPFTVPHACQPGTYPKVVTSGNGQVDVTLRGGLSTG